MNTREPALLRHLPTLADATRCRILRLLSRQELTVTEVCSVLQLPQSTVSRHLKTLQDDAWVDSRREGTSRFYTMSLLQLDTELRELWSLVASSFTETGVAAQDDARLDETLAGRRSRSQAYFASAAGQWNHIRGELFGAAFHLSALPALLDPRWVVGDLGCGTGQVTAAVAPFVQRVIAVDRSVEMLTVARENMVATHNVEFRQGELESLPIAGASLDAAVLVLVLHFLAEPAGVLKEVARVVKPDGRLLVVDMAPHDHEEYQHQMGHVWLGFSREHMERLLITAGFTPQRHCPMPAAVDARGPNLFAASARRATQEEA